MSELKKPNQNGFDTIIKYGAGFPKLGFWCKWNSDPFCDHPKGPEYCSLKKCPINYGSQLFEQKEEST